MTETPRVSPDLVCILCGALKVDMQHAESHEFTHCLSCGALTPPDRLRLYNLQRQAGQYTSPHPEWQGTIKTFGQEARHD